MGLRTGTKFSSADIRGRIVRQRLNTPRKIRVTVEEQSEGSMLQPKQKDRQSLKAVRLFLRNPLTRRPQQYAGRTLR